jgi:hypothetical protein
MAARNAKEGLPERFSLSAIAETLRRAAVETGDPAYRQALRGLLSQPLGRDDAALVAEGVWLIQTGKAKTAFAAATMVARSVTTDERAEHTIAVRVGRKIETELARQKNITNGL